MTEPITFSSRTSRFGLPYLFPGQAQKEFYVNEAHALVDALLQPVVEGSANTPPAQPAEGDCWLVDASPTDGWVGHATEMACFQAGSWLFAIPSEGMRVFDRSKNVYRHFRGSWLAPAIVTMPSGGTTIDTEARAAVAALIQALAGSGEIIQS